MLRALLSLLLICSLTVSSWAQGRVPVSGDLDAGTSSNISADSQALINKVRIENKLNSAVPLDLPFKDERGNDVKLGNYFGKKPVMLLMISFACRLLCDAEIANLQSHLNQLQFSPGKEFDIVISSIDPQEGVKMAAASKENFLKGYDRQGVENGVHFLTGSKKSIESLADSIGYRYAYDMSTRQWIHPATTILLTPEGKISRYFNKMDYEPRDLRLGLVETASNKIGTTFDTILLNCFHYSATDNRYSLGIMSLLRVLGACIVLGIVGGLVLASRAEKNRAPGALGENVKTA